MLTRDEVIWGYRYLLGRDPESEDAIKFHGREMKDYSNFRNVLLGSEEFGRVVSQVRESCWVAAPVFGGQRLLWIDLSDRFISLACLNNNYEPMETNFVKSNLRKDNVFVDIGANIGWFSMLASTIVGERGKVLSFEPRRLIFEKLEASVNLNRLGNMINVFQLALSNEPGEQNLVWEAGVDHTGGASLQAGHVSETMQTESVKVQRLDDIDIPRIDFLKIDVEGAEHLVMRGGEQTLRRNRPVILSEVFPALLSQVSQAGSDQYFDFFYNLDYRSYIVDLNKYGMEVRGFPKDWYRGLVNIAFVPRERTDITFS